MTTFQWTLYGMLYLGFVLGILFTLATIAIIRAIAGTMNSAKQKRTE